MFSGSRTLLVLITVLGLGLGVSACTPVGLVLGGAAGVGVSAYSERGVDGVARDLALTSRVLEKLSSHDHTFIAKVGVDVYESRALLTGQLDSEDQRADAVRLAWQVDGIVDVINEIHVTTEGGILNTARDAWISTQLEAKLTFDKKVLAINYMIETTGATVYLMGIAQSDTELQRVRDHARSIDYVRRIVSHVRVKQPLPDYDPNTAPNTASVK
ncbi:BON domain-containing protein [Magnetovibrio sp. PR-2]|uniref:BON domain-containing protein n=1 Tax=Magnetovibrio sp. PR-2 TaxID=3120356 RepID=UPI002FCE038F